MLINILKTSRFLRRFGRFYLPIMTLTRKKILLGITGSIAAYKSATLVRLLIKAGAEVKVLMTPAATEFISPLTISTLSKNPVHADIATDASWNNHVELGLWADVMIIAPLTATTLAKMAHGFCDNILTASYLSAKCPVFVAPAMDLDMWKHPSTQGNIEKIKSFSPFSFSSQDVVRIDVIYRAAIVVCGYRWARVGVRVGCET